MSDSVNIAVQGTIARFGRAERNGTRVISVLTTKATVSPKTSWLAGVLFEVQLPATVPVVKGNTIRLRGNYEGDRKVIIATSAQYNQKNFVF